MAQGVGYVSGSGALLLDESSTRAILTASGRACG